VSTTPTLPRDPQRARGTRPAHGAHAPGADARTRALAREMPSGRRPGWWGMVLFLFTDASAFASMIAAYFYLEFVTSPQWPPPGDPLPKLAKASIITGIIVASCVPLVLADRGLARGSRAPAALGTLATGLCGLAFVAIELWEYSDELRTTTPQKDAYGSIFYALTGFHVLHIMLGTLFLLVLALTAATGRLTSRHHVVVRVFGLYWYVSVVLWVLIYGALYWSVRL
jgi:heme/copper-type cytochrome/quinol oxidase subunit 3